MKNRINNNTIVILEKIKNNLQNDYEPDYKINADNLLKKVSILDNYKLDAIEVLIDYGFKIEPKEYKSLMKKRNEFENKGIDSIGVRLLMRKYENALVYLIEIGCLENLKSFKDDFLCKLTNRFQRECITSKKVL